jgi:GT2 family glycosyltransferase
VQTLSVVIPTLNRADLLARTIDAIENQTVPREHYEVIVVDNDSSDDTALILAEKVAQFKNLRFTCEKRPGAAATRNTGLQHADGDIVLFIDDDIEADPELIEGHLRYHAAQSDASIVGTIRTQWDNTANPFLRYLRDRRIYNPYKLGTGRMDFSCYHTGNVSTPRDLLNATGGFDERFSVYGMEDIELGYRLERLGSVMVPGTDAIGTHNYSPTFEQFTERCEQAGFSLGLMLGLHPELSSRFTENGALTRLLRPFHRVYQAVAPLVDPAVRAICALEGRQGTGAVSPLLAFHFDWALRYHFFVGYTRYLTAGSSALVAVKPRPVEELDVKKTASKVESGSVVSS